MEKRKDIDMLRFYGGDIHQKNKEGEYVITNNLVNPKNKEDVLWGDRDAYRTLNVRVVAAVIKAVKEDGRTMIFATQRGYGEFKGGWEFPGGKIEAGETPQEALKREIMEELDTEVAVGEWIETVEYDYPGFHLSMDCFWCEIVKGDLVLKEHEAARWLTREELTDVEWLPADVAVAEKIEEEMD